MRVLAEQNSLLVSACLFNCQPQSVTGGQAKREPEREREKEMKKERGTGNTYRLHTISSDCPAFASASAIVSCISYLVAGILHLSAASLDPYLCPFRVPGILICIASRLQVAIEF